LSPASGRSCSARVSLVRDRCQGGCAVRGWVVHTDIARLRSLCLVGLLLAALAVPRFGLVWHDHEDPDAHHPHHQLLRLLTSSQEPPALHHVHPHAEESHVVLVSDEDSHAHGHYVDDSLLVVCCVHHPLTRTLLRMSLRPCRPQRFIPRRQALFMVRAPPDAFLLVPCRFSTSVRALSRVA